jgi:predicted ArsR family transcriptional regulator
MAAYDEQSTRWDILQFLKRNGCSEAKQIAEHCGLSTMAISRHLAQLKAEQLIAGTVERRPRGRPTAVYVLTDLGDAKFPRDYGGLAREMLTALEASDGENKVNEVFRRRRQDMSADCKKRVRGKGFESRVRETAQILTERGYMAEAEKQQDGSFLLTEYNCAIRDVAQCFPAACHEELHFLEDLTGGNARRRSHLVAGDCNCSYLITRRDGRRPDEPVARQPKPQR